MQQQKNKFTARKELIRQKQVLADDIYRKYKYRIPDIKLSVYSLEEISTVIKTKAQINYKLKKAAVKIQRWWKSVRPSTKDNLKFKDVHFLL